MNDTVISHYKTRLEEYQPIVGSNIIDELKLLGSHLAGRKVQNINSTFSGGGVAEILARIVPLLQQLGIDATWDVIQGDDAFFNVTKKFHNALHGRDESITTDDLDIFMETSRRNNESTALDADIFYIHDPQPIMLIERKKSLGGKWIWRCHVDVSHPDKVVWKFLRKYVVGYDATVFSSPEFSQQLPSRQYMISPSIDPLSDKNREISQSVIQSVLDKYGLDNGKPMVVQISRFDYLKDPLGVIQAFRMVRKGIDCQLVLAGGTATDDPESTQVLEEVRENAGNDPDIKILPIPPGSDLEINALQRAATVVFQKSLKEGFGLTISEALWKSKPVVATAVGGIPQQVRNKVTGLLCHSVDGAAYALKQLLSNPDYAAWLGKNGHEHVKQNFLITRHVKEYLLLFLAVDNPSEIINL
ncbi:MAG: glycosyltransferase [Dehalococcoidia bacterium]|nr:glycosyltransferase [Dehalococcoidia bacterium]